ncbi:MAG: hypothetical protein AB8V21_10580 [Arsenophonus endosymbiont of Dermacentor nuttalli]
MTISRRLVNIKYDSFDSALRSAPFMMAAKALSVETINAKILFLARQYIVCNYMKNFVYNV